MALDTIWIFAEGSQGIPTSTTLELVAKAVTLGGTVEAFYGGRGEDLAAALGAYGVSRIYATGEMGDALTAPTVAAVMAGQVAEGNRPELIMVAMTYDGRDVVARLSVRLDRPVLTNGTAISVEGKRVVVESAIFGGGTLVHTAFVDDPPYLAAFRPKSFTVSGPLHDAPAEVVTVKVPDIGMASAVRVIERHGERRSGPQLDDAAVVVAGGRGVGGPEGFALVERVAQLLNGAPAATRAIVDTGWAPYACQVGQTGKTVNPTLYLACGVSGATQHVVGFKGAKSIIAINKDRHAPIFEIADLGIVGDIHTVLPKLIEALESREAQSD